MIPQYLQEHPLLRQMDLDQLKHIYLTADLATDIRFPAVDFRCMDEYDVRKDLQEKYSYIHPIFMMPIYYLESLNAEKETLAVVSYSTMIQVNDEIKPLHDIATLFLYKGYLVPNAPDAGLLYAILNHLHPQTVLSNPARYFSDMTASRDENGQVALLPSKDYFKSTVEPKCTPEEQLQFIMATDLTFQGMCLRGLRFT